MSQVLEYTALTDPHLVSLIFSEGDRLPRAAADEIIRRGVPVAPALIQILDDETSWTAEEPRWWAVVHAAYLLASMQPPGALEALVRALPKADEHQVEWISNDARYLLGSFGPSAVPLLRTAALDGTLGTYVRIWVDEALSWIGQNHGEARDEVARVLRAVVRDEAADPDTRAFAACELLEFALPEDRELLLASADGWIYREEDVSDAYDGESPRRRRPGYDCLQFYGAAEIAERQERWRREERRRERREADHRLREGPVPTLNELSELKTSYREMMGLLGGDSAIPRPIRAEPKVGRNDPCPCNSGKKYKKCCG